MDSLEILTETKKNLELQSAFWSDHKHHHPVKLILCIGPNLIRADDFNIKIIHWGVNIQNLH